MKTYISLFSSAGIGCYGFKMEGFECIATNELIERRLGIQKANRKCKYPTGYICGDITKDETKRQLYDEIDFWKRKEKIKRVDVVIATPPCQGMSFNSVGKRLDEIRKGKAPKDDPRNRLIIPTINLVKRLKPQWQILLP